MPANGCRNPSDTEESEDELQDLDLATGNKDTCVLEVHTYIFFLFDLLLYERTQAKLFSPTSKGGGLKTKKKMHSFIMHSNDIKKKLHSSD